MVKAKNLEVITRMLALKSRERQWKILGRWAMIRLRVCPTHSLGLHVPVVDQLWSETGPAISAVPVVSQVDVANNGF